jgi:hypothetical protein
MNWAWRQNLPSTAKLVLLALADAADDEGNCWPSVATIAGKAGVTTRTVRRVMETLTWTPPVCQVKTEGEENRLQSYIRPVGGV